MAVDTEYLSVPSASYHWWKVRTCTRAAESANRSPHRTTHCGVLKSNQDLGRTPSVMCLEKRNHKRTPTERPCATMDDLDAHRAYGPHNHLSGGDPQASPVTRDDAPTANKTRGYKGPRKQEGIKRACNECRQQKAGPAPLSDFIWVTR